MKNTNSNLPFIDRKILNLVELAGVDIRLLIPETSKRKIRTFLSTLFEEEKEAFYDYLLAIITKRGEKPGDRILPYVNDLMIRQYDLYHDDFIHLTEKYLRSKEERQKLRLGAGRVKDEAEVIKYYPLLPISLDREKYEKYINSFTDEGKMAIYNFVDVTMSMNYSIRTLQSAYLANRDVIRQKKESSRYGTPPSCCKSGSSRSFKHKPLDYDHNN